MSLLQGIEGLRLVPREPDWIDGLAIAWRKRGIARRLRRLREMVEREADTSIAQIEAPVACTLFDVCGALRLNEAQTRAVLGEAGWAAVFGPVRAEPEWEDLILVAEQKGRG